MIEEEVWKDVVGYPLYKISDMGRIKRLENHKEIYRQDIDSSYLAFRRELILSPSKAADGYLSVKLYTEGGFKNLLVHRVVAQVFIINTENKPTVNHINGVKDDNRVFNLEWSTGKEQSQHANEHNLIAEHLRMRKVLVYDSNWNFLNEYPSMKDAERALGVLQARISEICRGIRKSPASGYLFEYANY